jgi:Histidine kinase-like ATPase domain
MTSSHTPGGAQAAERIARTITVVAGVATFVFLALSIAPMVAAAPFLDPQFALISALVVFGIPPILALLTPVLTLSNLKRALGLYALVFLCVVVAWIPATTSTPLPTGVAPWPLEITALATVPAAIAWRPLLAWSYLVLNSVLIAPVRIFADGGSDLATSLQYAFFTLTFSAIFTALAMVAMRNGYTLDAVTASAMEAAARSAASDAQAREQTRLDALVHDEVMGTLFYASQGDPKLDDSVRAQAVRALEQLGRLRGGRDAAADAVPADGFVAMLKSAVLAGAPQIVVTVTGERDAPIPADVAAAFVEAAAEAANNIRVHAGREGEQVTSEASIVLDTAGIAVTVRDSGIGFDPSAVAPHRLGILVSIRARLATLAGGSANVESSPGKGTTVALDWRTT